MPSQILLNTLMIKLSVSSSGRLMHLTTSLRIAMLCISHLHPKVLLYAYIAQHIRTFARAYFTFVSCYYAHLLQFQAALAVLLHQESERGKIQCRLMQARVLTQGKPTYVGVASAADKCEEGMPPISCCLRFGHSLNPQLVSEDLPAEGSNSNTANDISPPDRASSMTSTSTVKTSDDDDKGNQKRKEPDSPVELGPIASKQSKK